MVKPKAVLAAPLESRIHIIRQQKIILDSDLAELYGVSAKRLNQQVRRNRDRFPADFLFQLKAAEFKSLRLQNATSKTSRGGRRYLPFAFTEHGAVMAATVLNSERAIQMSVFVVRAFVRLRLVLASNRQVSAKIDELEQRLDTHDNTIQELIDAIRDLMEPKQPTRRKIGFELPAKTAIPISSIRLSRKAAGAGRG